MSKRIFIGFFTVVLALVLPIGLSAEQTHDLQGRDIAAAGERKTLTGVLHLEDGEWYLEADGVTYTLHLGRSREDADKIFRDNLKATADGFVQASHIAPIEVKANGKSVSVWTEERRPIWAGQGNGRNRK